MVIVVSPQQRAAKIYTSPRAIAVLTEKDTLEGGEVLPGWKLALKMVFA